ncbi:MAG: T9SS type A sorting domain-containing protein, partial [Balneolaceae bacterium]
DKLWPIFRQEQEQPQASLLYFMRERQGRQQYLAQEARPFNPESAFEVRLGHVILNTSGAFTISWPEMKNIPDMWSLTLVDHISGRSVDMKQESSYRFESTSTRPDEYDFSRETDIHPVRNLPADNRFSIQVTPDPMKTIQEETAEEDQPDNVQLFQNFPNPFNPATNIKFYLPEQRHVNVGVYNIVGQRVALLLDEPLQQGEHILTWDATDIPSGIYIVQLELGSRVLTRKMTLIK